MKHTFKRTPFWDCLNQDTVKYVALIYVLYFTFEEQNSSVIYVCHNTIETLYMTEIICPLRFNYVLIIVFYIVVAEKLASTSIKHVNYLHEISTKPLKVICPICRPNMKRLNSNGIWKIILI